MRLNEEDGTDEKGPIFSERAASKLYREESSTVKFMNLDAKSICLILMVFLLGILIGSAHPEALQFSSVEPSWSGDWFIKVTTKEYVAKLKVGCGEICDRTIQTNPHSNPDLPPWVRKKVDCKALWANVYNDMPQTEAPPKQIPEELRNAYLYDGKVQTGSLYFHQVYQGSKAFQSVWSKKLLEDQMKQAKRGTLEGSYNIEVTNKVKAAIAKMNIKGHSVLVIGSERPWVEALCLLSGAAKVTTLEYGSIKSEHPQIVTMTPMEMRGKVLADEIELYDDIITWSSVEHSGLGRYGDAMNPWGDVITIAKASCLTKPNAKMLLGVPTDPKVDTIVWNAHRIYGPVMMPHLAANWKANLFIDHGESGGFIFEKLKPLE